MNIEVYSDGSATTADKPGGYAWVIVIDGEKHSEGAGHVPLATNNDMELEAAIQGLASALKFINLKTVEAKTDIVAIEKALNIQVTLVSDSQLVLGWANGSYRFKQVDKMTKYHQLRSLVSRMKVKTQWVEGHTGHEHNERCDKLANAARIKQNLKEEHEEAKAKGDSLIGDKKVGIVCVWFEDQLKVIDLENNIVENYNREIHGKRGSMLEIRREKSR